MSFDARFARIALVDTRFGRYSHRVNQSGACSSSDVITNSHFETTLELPGRRFSHDVNLRLLCSEFHARMKRVNSKCLSVQLRANSAILRFVRFIRVGCERTLRTGPYAFAHI